MKKSSLLRQYQIAVDESNLVSRTDINGLITYVNDSFCKTLLYTREELLGRNHSMLRSPQTSNDKFQELWQTITSGNIWKGLVEDIDKIGNSHYFNSTIMPLFDDDGNTVEYIAIRQDVTELFEAKQEAHKALEIKTNFLNQMSHELRTPLNAIINFVGQVIDDFDDILTDEEFRAMAKNFLTRAHNNSQNLLEIINSLLDASKLESGKEKFLFENFDLVSFIKEVHANTLSLVKNKNIKYFVESSVTKATISADTQKLRQVLFNLVSNAVKFTQQGYVLIRLTETSERYLLEIEDSGCGIPSESIDTIYDAFVQVNTHDIGTGLGLKIVKEYCLAMKIELSVNSTVGQGTTFGLKFNKG